MGNVENRKAAGKPSTLIKDVDRVRETVMRILSTSTCSTNLQLGIPRTTVRGILHKGLKLHPNKVQLLHELKPNNKLNISFWRCIFFKKLMKTTVI
ncbi:hypothetical protein NPIL_665901 [Nephila pilipes]|uniref:Uncharacterized protein n=1 Tax=Nephila pilipes TaxID=299642 RepID=A0A8X6JM36_NEPPI|nr:hypothetical protein NPIL_665901 [Nephila pilipes]